jgi:hypothetical protein
MLRNPHGSLTIPKLRRQEHRVYSNLHRQTFRTAYGININATDAHCPTQLNTEYYTS